jgi:hypothetical protein
MALPELELIIKKFKLIAADVDGCQVGVISKYDGQPILKPWRFVCSNSGLAESLSALRCRKTHSHAQCQGGDTVLTGFYPKMLTDIMINNIFCGSESASVVSLCHQPPGGSPGFEARKFPPVIDSIKTVDSPCEPFVSDLVCSVVPVIEPVSKEAESDLYDYLINKGIQIGLDSIATHDNDASCDNHIGGQLNAHTARSVDKRILEYENATLQEEYVNEKQNNAYSKMGLQIERSINKAMSKLNKYEKARKSPPIDTRSANSGGLMPNKSLMPYLSIMILVRSNLVCWISKLTIVTGRNCVPAP